MDDSELSLTIELVEAHRAGDARATERLFERYLPRIRRIVAIRMGYTLKAFLDLDDLVQEALIKVFNGLERFEARTEASFRHWVASCVECAIRDARRHASRQKRGGGKVRRISELGDSSISESIFAGDGPTPSNVAQAQEMEEKLEAGLLTLADPYREAIVLRSFCGMSHEEIAERLGFDKVGTARQTYARALQKLRAVL